MGSGVLLLACSHIYASDGQGLRYKLSKIKDVTFDAQKNPYLSENEAYQLGLNIKELFFSSFSSLPKRVVIHKRTPFKEEEIAGLTKCLGSAGIKDIDLIEITYDENFKCLRVFYEKGIDNLDTVIEAASHIIESMEMLFSGSVYDLAKFDEQDFVDEYLGECYAEAYDEKLDYYVDKAMSAASNTFAELAEEAKDEADMLLGLIEELETIAKRVLKLFKSLPLNDIRIDNTKK